MVNKSSNSKKGIYIEQLNMLGGSLKWQKSVQTYINTKLQWGKKVVRLILTQNSHEAKELICTPKLWGMCISHAHLSTKKKTYQTSYF